MITAKKEPPVAGQLNEQATAQESLEDQESASQDSQPLTDNVNIQSPSENKEVHSGDTEQNEASQDIQSPQTGEDSTVSSTSSENTDSHSDETSQNPAVVSVGQNEVFCAATGKPCAVPNSQHTHEHSADSANQAESSNIENTNSEIRTPAKDTQVDSGSETNTEEAQSSQNTNDEQKKNDPSTDSTEHRNDDKIQDDATIRT